MWERAGVMIKGEEGESRQKNSVDLTGPLENRGRIRRSGRESHHYLGVLKAIETVASGQPFFLSVYFPKYEKSDECRSGGVVPGGDFGGK